VDSLTAGLLVVDRDGRVEILNRAGRRLLGISAEPAAADYRELLASAPPLVAVVAESLDSGHAIARRELKMPETLPASHLGVTISPLAGSAGVICLFADLTNVVALEEQLRLKDTLARLGELTAGIAHEFRNGLATIHGYSKLIDLKALPANYRQYVEGIRAEAESLSQVVTNFLNFARPAQLTLGPVDLQAVCERAADELRGEARTLGGEITVRGEFGTLEGDEVLLRQAFSNLLRNAVEACAGASLAPVVVVQAEVDTTQHLMRIVVDDNGPGIEPARREQVFRPFVTSKRNGTGLGLALVQKIIVFHNGRITVGTSPLGGASLQVSLPLHA
jgi:signal transduction histidine kinase